MTAARSRLWVCADEWVRMSMRVVSASFFFGPPPKKRIESGQRAMNEREGHTHLFYLISDYIAYMYNNGPVDGERGRVLLLGGRHPVQVDEGRDEALRRAARGAVSHGWSCVFGRRVCLHHVVNRRRRRRPHSPTHLTHLPNEPLQVVFDSHGRLFPFLLVTPSHRPTPPPKNRPHRHDRH